MENWIGPLAVLIICIGFTIIIVKDIMALNVLMYRLKQSLSAQLITPIIYLMMFILYTKIELWISFGFGYLGMLFFFKAFFPDGIFQGGIKHSNRIIFWNDVQGYQIDTIDEKQKNLKLETTPMGFFKKTLYSFKIDHDSENEIRSQMAELGIEKTSKRKL
jgi:hypothetical protein